MAAALVLATAPGAMGLFTQPTKLLANDGAVGDLFGYSVAISGDRLVIGAWFDNDKGTNSGSAYVFERNAGTWTQAQKLLANDGAAFDHFGYSVAISGDRLVIGAVLDDDKGSASGSAYVFERNAGTWTQAQKLLANDGTVGDWFGYSVAISADRLVIGAAYDDSDAGPSSGSAYVFERNAGTWTQAQKLLASDGAAIDEFGHSVAISGDRLVIGSVLDDDKGSASGSAYVFARNIAGTWTETQKLLATDGAAFDFFGSSVAMSGDHLVIGARFDDDNGFASGSAYVFRHCGPDVPYAPFVPEVVCDVFDALPS